MVKLVLLFKSASKSGDFERRFGRNLDLLKTMPGVQRIEVNKVLGSPTGQAPYHRIVELFFEDMAALDQALTSPEGVTAGKDLMGFAAQQVELLFVEVSDAAATPPPLTPDNLQAYLDSHDVPAEIIYPGQPTPTVEKAAEALGVEPDQIVKSVLFLVDNKPFLVFACGTRRVDFQKLADRLNVSKKKVKLAAPEQVLDLTGFAVGTVPPLGLKTPMPAYLDPSVQAHEVIYAGGGGDNAMLKITSADLLKISDAEIAPMLQDETPP
ncbi:MAG: EthD family reductase, partial [Anaerolineae bacterium]|nr:EthD family reductase [Anaerolineae bacterium]